MRYRYLLLISITCATLATQASFAYTPPSNNIEILHGIDFSKGKPIQEHLEGMTYACKLPGGAIYVEAGMTVDADGSPNYRELDPRDGQKDTALQLDSKNLDSEKIPYIVLPGAAEGESSRKSFYERMGLEKGDIAAVVFDGKIAFAIFGDVGPKKRMGEGSIKLMQMLGWDPISVMLAAVKYRMFCSGRLSSHEDLDSSSGCISLGDLRCCLGSKRSRVQAVT